MSISNNPPLDSRISHLEQPPQSSGFKKEEESKVSSVLKKTGIFKAEEDASSELRKPTRINNDRAAVIELTSTEEEQAPDSDFELVDFEEFSLPDLEDAKRTLPSQTSKDSNAEFAAAAAQGAQTAINILPAATNEELFEINLEEEDVNLNADYVDVSLADVDLLTQIRQLFGHYSQIWDDKEALEDVKLSRSQESELALFVAQVPDIKTLAQEIQADINKNPYTAEFVELIAFKYHKTLIDILEKTKNETPGKDELMKAGKALMALQTNTLFHRFIRETHNRLTWEIEDGGPARLADPVSYYASFFKD